MTDTEVLRARVLDWLLDYEPEQPGAIPEINKLAGDEEDLSPAGQDMWRNVLWGLRDDGVVKLAESFGFNWGVWLTPYGRRHAEGRRARRQDAAARRAYTRNRLLAWLYEQPDHHAEDTTGFLTSPSAYFEGFLLESSDVDQALEYLNERGLVTGYSVDIGLVHPRLMTDGIDCIDHYGGSVTDYLRRDEGARTSNTVNIGGSVSGSNLALGNRDVGAQNAQIGASSAELGSILQAILEAIPALNLSTDDEGDLRASVRMAGNELAEAKPDTGLTKALLTKIGSILGKTVETALGPVLGAYLRVLAKKHGIDLGDPQ